MSEKVSYDVTFFNVKIERLIITKCSLLLLNLTFCHNFYDNFYHNYGFIPHF